MSVAIYSVGMSAVSVGIYNVDLSTVSVGIYSVGVSTVWVNGNNAETYICLFCVILYNYDHHSFLSYFLCMLFMELTLACTLPA